LIDLPEVVVTAQRETPHYTDISQLYSLSVNSLGNSNSSGQNSENQNRPVPSLAKKFIPMGGKGKDDDDKMRGGKQKHRDRSIKKYPKEFNRYYHREIKPVAHPGRNATDEELAQAYEEWQRYNQIVGVGVVVGIATYETVKWTIAILGAPETLGGSIVAATIIP